jgi:glucose/arabinose dehydrogenase
LWRSRLVAIAGVSLLLAGCGSSMSSGAPVISGHGVRLVRIGVFDQPTYATGAPGDRSRLFVLSKGGKIVVLVRGHRISRPFLNIRGSVASGGSEQGLLSLAFAPDYADSRRFYVDYTGSNGDIHVVQYRRSSQNPNLAETSSARPVLTIAHHEFPNHNGGQLAFGPDGDLYVGVGDGGNEDDPDGRGQNTGVLLGKVLRIRPGATGGYAIPGGNPFAQSHRSRPEIWAYGLRNPWRFSFDRLTGDLIISDVGQDAQEEIDFARHGRGAGANYGWSVFEGSRRNKPGSAPGAVPPELVKLHSRGYCAIIGGYVVRDRSLKGLYGRYLYGDDCNPQVRSVRLTAGRALGDSFTGLDVPEMSSFGEDAMGRVYAVSLEGPVYRFAPR